jgi:DeoR/GlpR family transcriptional regulator of sugar metabolism
MGPESPVPQKIVDYVTGHDAISIEEIMQDLNVSRNTAKNGFSVSRGNSKHI